MNHGPGLSEGVIEMSGRKLATLLCGSMVGGLVGAMGLGGAIVFNPVMLTLGVVP